MIQRVLNLHISANFAQSYKLVLYLQVLFTDNLSLGLIFLSDSVLYGALAKEVFRFLLLL